MKQYSLLVLINLILLFGCSNASENTDPYIVIKPEPNENPSVTIPMKGICIFAGQANTFTDDDWQALANSAVTDFIVIPKDAGQYGANETGYKTQLGIFMVNVINQLVTRKSTAKIWIGTPGLSSLNYTTASSSLDPIYNYLNFVRDQVGTSIWNTNIGGIYMNMESIYGTVDYTNILANPCIKLMSDLSSRIHNNLKTKFLWIPYYGYGSNPDEIIKRMAYVTNKSTIFDYVVIQPHYYFDESVAVNLSGVKHSISKQAICYRDGLVVIPKLSKTVIGAEMELSWRVVPPNNYTDFLNRYNEYVSSFAEFKGTYPIIFYWDGTLQNVLTGRINPFFNNN
jgi:hypothetical protein